MKCLLLYLMIVALWRLCKTQVPQHYDLYDIFEDCKPSKNVRKIYTAAIFRLNESVRVNKNDYYCHYELETRSSQRFFVHIDDLNIAENLEKRSHWCRGFYSVSGPLKYIEGESDRACSSSCDTDYLQFGRDRGLITTFSSCKSCGQLQYHDVVNEDTCFDQRPRMYREIKDAEMDVWINLARNLTQPSRTLELTVTAFKRGCSSSDRYFKQCSRHSHYCVEKSLFCDGRVNCPDGEDEYHCNQEEAESSGPNIPMIIIAVCVFLIIGLGLLIAAKKLQGFMTFLRSEGANNRSPQPRPHWQPPDQVALGIPEANVVTPQPDLDLPPSYDEVIRDDLLKNREENVINPGT